MKTFPTILKAVAAVAAGLLLFSCTKKAELSVSPKSLTFSADIIEAQPQTVTVTTNTAWRASVSENWLSISPVSGPESGSFTVSVVNFNKELTDRTAKITVVADDLIEEITVTQKAIVPVLQVETNGWDLNTPIPAKGAARQLNVTCNVPWTLTVTGGGDWFVYGPESGNDNSYVTLGWHGNFDFEPRTVKLVFSAAGKEASLSLTQLAAEPSRQIDSLALVAIYNASNGAEWTKGNWDLATPVNTWTGVTVDAESNRVTALKLTTTVGIPSAWTLPKETAKLTALTDLRINKQKISGDFPEVVYDMTWLQVLYLQGNDITGALSSKLGQLTELTDLYIDSNAKMSGPLPKEIGKLTKLVRLNISQSGIDGAIPVELGQCVALEQFMAFKSQLTGELPDIWDLPKLQTVMLRDSPGLTGNLPASLGKLKPMVKGTTVTAPSIQLYGCNFTGNIPETFAELHEKTKQVYVQDNKMSGVIPAAVVAHPNFASWKIGPQQEGYGLTLE